MFFSKSVGNAFLFHVFFLLSSFTARQCSPSLGTYFSLSNMIGKYGCCPEISFTNQMVTISLITSHLNRPHITKPLTVPHLFILPNTSEKKTWFGQSYPEVEKLEIHEDKVVTGKANVIKCHKESHPKNSEMLK